ncbi:glycoside hydrolase family 78 protein [Macroventuria anomochaeta]|uniref:Glycoside hydrolase family 78 protein n=1 Tax=Macroventuria anomochaeta TaxID=301207 RepID=A0ACB6S5N6_9PLEO|nr:glycoside hydrolase family 78 protein [Macroventuria anomochaeta]KAF2629297.1 glycoside hydrolase family 78 protein [Macroventuria anomochaeta]
MVLSSSHALLSRTSYSQRATLSSTGLSSWTNTSLTLSPSNPLVTLDYGFEVAGFPFFSVAAVSGLVQIEVKYTEEFSGLLQPYSDGPWTFSNGLSNTFRVETFNVTSTGYIESFFVQGGQRWQTARLITNGSVTINRLGFRLTSSNVNVDKLAGHLKTYDEIYDRVFDLGGRVVQAACIDAGNAPSTWEITDDGALIRGQASAQSSLGVTASNYTLEFDMKIVRGGAGWRVASAIQPLGPYFVLTSEYTEHNTFANTNRTLLPPNTLAFNSGWGLINQSTLSTPENQYFTVNKTIKENTWYHVSTTIEATGYRVPSPYEGTWGLGGMQDHITYHKDVTVTARNGSIVYSNSLTTENTLAEYQVAPLDHSVCLDGAKRDRLVWAGDFYHTVRVVALSSARFDYILGSIEYILSYQLDDGPYAGFVPISANLGSRPQYKEANIANYAGLVDYQDLFLTGVGEYFRYTGNVDALSPYWGQIKKLATARLSFIDLTSGLVAGSPQVSNPFSFLGPANGSATTGLFAYMLDKIAPLADALGDEEASTLYSQTASQLREALNRELWNDQLGTYSLSTASPGNFSLTGIAWAILSGATNDTQAASSIARLEELRFAVGFKTISSDVETDDYQLAPNPSGFLLEALFKARRDFGVNSTAAVTHLLDNLWGSMVNNNEYYSGASWEYVKPDGSPGIDLFTSLAHPWGAAPTYVLPEYLLGVAPTSPGYRTANITPMIGYLNLPKVSGRVPTPNGPIEVAWTVDDTSVDLTIVIPTGISATLQLPSGMRVGENDSHASQLEASCGMTRFKFGLQ